MQSRPKSLLIFAVCMIGLAAAGRAGYFAFRPTQDVLIERAKRARAAKDLRLARNYASSAVSRDPTSAVSQRVFGQIASELGQIDEAIAAFEIASQSEGADAISGSLLGGRLALQQGRAELAEKLWKRCLQLNPRQVDASSELGYLLGVEGRGWEMQQVLLAVVRAGQPTVHHMVLLGASEPVVRDATLVKRCLEREPGYLNIQSGEARNDLFEGRTEQALLLLRQICQTPGVTAESQARLGWAILELHPDQFVAWWQQTTEFDLPEHPETWAVRGAWGMHVKNLPLAAKCFARAISLDPEHRMANYQLGSVLTQLGRSPEAEPFLNRAAKLQQLALLVDRIYAHPQETLLYRQATELTAALGRPHEAWGWCYLALQINPRLEWALVNVDKLQPWLTSSAPRAIPEGRPSIPMDLLDSAVPVPTSESYSPGNSPFAPDSSGSTPLFENVAAAIGLDFIYDAGSRRRADGVDAIEFSGGGVAAWDYDRDDRCDLFFPQGRSIPLSQKSAGPTDRLFRQSVDDTAIDVTPAAGLGDTDYSQGCAVGDFDQDGFPDLYVCNVGPNRLYRNNGDGTFDDVTESAGLSGNDWTVSAMFADLNGDGLPELFDVNYLDIEIAEIPFCRRGAEDTHCAPSSRPPAADRLWWNDGLGAFRDISRQSGLTSETEIGRGLGIVAADLNGDGQLDLFIGNDADPNFLYFNRSPRAVASSPPGSIVEFPLPRLEESGVVAGVAYDRDGLAQACMGIAIGDADQNGMLDLFVTNYADQSNTLYLQVEPGLFQDGTREAGLREPSFALLGFGTQFLDADLDGRLDLILTNGHVFDMSYAGKRYAMRPQFFRNSGQGRFTESFREQVGEFFGGAYVGRGMARLDWNRDGREDIAISQIGSPAALLANRTSRHGHYLSLTFSGVLSERDAIGTMVRVFDSRGLQSTHQLVAGDGYQARNEPRLIIGLGSAGADIRRLEVQWPSGLTQAFDNVPIDQRLHLIEGRNRFVAISGARVAR